MNAQSANSDALAEEHAQFTDESGTWCREGCPRPDAECGALAVWQNDSPIPPASTGGGA